MLQALLSSHPPGQVLTTQAARGPFSQTWPAGQLTSPQQLSLVSPLSTIPLPQQFVFSVQPPDPSQVWQVPLQV